MPIAGRESAGADQNAKLNSPIHHQSPSNDNLKGLARFVGYECEACGGKLYWFSPFTLSASVQAHLAEAGIERFPDPQDQPPQDCLLVYVPPHTLFVNPVGMGTLLAGYSTLLEHGLSRRLIADWRLLGLDPQGIAGWVRGEHPCPATSSDLPTLTNPLSAVLLRVVLDSTPELLDGYLDLELRAELANRPPDTAYAQRLLTTQPPEVLISAWWTQQEQLAEGQQLVERHLAGLEALNREVKQRDEVLAAARAEGQTTTDQLQLLQAELGQARQQATDQAQQLAETQQQVEQHQARISTLNGEIKQRDEALAAARAEGQATTLQLLHLQEGLENSFKAHQQAQARSKELESQMKEGEEQLAAVLQELTTVRGDGEQLRLRLEKEQAQLETLNGEIEQRDVALAAARAEGQATTLQLQHLQEGLEKSFQAHQQAEARSKELENKVKEGEEQLAAVLQELTTVRGDGEQLRLRLEEKQAQLETLNGEIEQRDVALAAARAEGHATTLQLHHVQEGLENSFKAHQQAQKDQLQANREFQSKREQQLMAERQADLEKVLAALHQTEEELEHYFLQTQHGRQLVDAQQVQLQRGAALLRRMAALKGVTTGYPLSQPIQVMALLEGYRQSLKRAERLLGREVFSGEASRISE